MFTPTTTGRSRTRNIAGGRGFPVATTITSLTYIGNVIEVRWQYGDITPSRFRVTATDSPGGLPIRDSGDQASTVVGWQWSDVTILGDVLEVALTYWTDPDERTTVVASIPVTPATPGTPTPGLSCTWDDARIWTDIGNWHEC